MADSPAVKEVRAGLIRSPIRAPKILLMGEAGTGKTHAIRTLCATGIKPYVVALEPGFDVLSNVPVESLGWRYIPQHAEGWQTLIDEADKVSRNSYAVLQAARDPGLALGKFPRYRNFLSALAKFTDERTGTELGCVDDWGTNRCLVIDNLSEVCKAMMEDTIGAKSVPAQNEWMIAQNNLENFVRQLVTATRCWVVVIAHLDKLVDEIQGGQRIMMQSLGKALSPKLPQLFSDVVMAKREGTKFTWSTAEPSAILKSRNLPIAQALQPDFAQIVATWKARGGLIEQQ